MKDEARTERMNAIPGSLSRGSSQDAIRPPRPVRQGSRTRLFGFRAMPLLVVCTVLLLVVSNVWLWTTSSYNSPHGGTAIDLHGA